MVRLVSANTTRSMHGGTGFTPLRLPEQKAVSGHTHKQRGLHKSPSSKADHAIYEANFTGLQYGCCFCLHRGSPDVLAGSTKKGIIENPGQRGLWSRTPDVPGQRKAFN